jgi:type VI secretion system secreted protein Hcp
MSVDMFLNLEGVDGESRDGSIGKSSPVSSKAIDILAWSWGMSQSGTTHMGGGGGAGKVSVQDLSITKYVDNSSAVLMKKCSDGGHIPTACLTVRKAGEDPLVYILIEMDDIIVTSLSTGGSGGEDRLTENVSLNFAEVKVTYVQQKDDGTGEPAVEYGWKIAENVPK